jgi:hypothetical protein
MMGESNSSRQYQAQQWQNQGLDEKNLPMYRNIIMQNQDTILEGKDRMQY